MNATLRNFIFFCLGSFITSAWASGPLRSIVIFGNEKTERQTILDMLNIPPQTYVNEKVVQDVEDRLMHSGLFKTVKVRKVDNRDGTADIRMIVLEKQLWFAFPIFQAWSGRYNGGAAFGESNLFVPGGSTIFLFQAGNKLSQGFAAFDAKHIFDSNFSVRTWVLGRSDDVPLYNGNQKVDEINMEDAAFELRPGYQWTNDIQTVIKFGYSYVMYGQSALVANAGEQGHDVKMEFQFIYDTLRRRDAFVKGTKLTASYEFADARFGSDFTYHTQGLSWEQAFPLFKYLNYDYTIEGKIGDETLPFHREFTLGGSSLRGYDDRQFRGDTLVTARQNLLFNVFKHSKFSVFGAAFYDMGLLYNNATEGISRDAFRNGVGGGLRISLSDILAPVFGLDVGYGIEDQSVNIYFALGLVEF